MAVSAVSGEKKAQYNLVDVSRYLKGWSQALLSDRTTGRGQKPKHRRFCLNTIEWLDLEGTIKDQH